MISYLGNGKSDHVTLYRREPQCVIMLSIPRNAKSEPTPCHTTTPREFLKSGSKKTW